MRLFFLPSVTAVVCACIVLTSGGCASDADARRERAEQRAEAAAAIPEMEAAGTFFGGRIEVAVLLNRGGFRAAAVAGAEGTRGREGGGRGRGGFRGGFGGFGGRGGGGGRREGGFGGAGEGGQGGEAPAPHITAANQPPVALHLRLTNHTGAAVEVEVPDFESDLGNFVVQPDKIAVAANGSADADPMISRLGVTQATIPLTVALRMNGQTETQTLSLRIKPPPAPPANAPATAPPASRAPGSAS